MAKKKDNGYLSARESRRIAKENRKITDQFEKLYKRKNVPESEYLTTMHDSRNALEIDNLHTYFFTDVGVAKAVDGVSFDVPLGKTIGVVGAGNISRRIMEYADFFGMKVLCWTQNPDRHRNLESRGVSFVSMDMLMQTADVISVNLPNNSGTKNLISRDRIEQMKENGIFVSVSRLETVDAHALFEKAAAGPINSPGMRTETFT